MCVICIQSCPTCKQRYLIVSRCFWIQSLLFLLREYVYLWLPEMPWRPFVFDWYLTLIFHFNCLCHWDVTCTVPSLASHLSLRIWWSHIMITIFRRVISLEECSLVWAKHAILHKTGVFTQTGVADWHSGNHHHPTVRATELQVAWPVQCSVHMYTNHPAAVHHRWPLYTGADRGEMMQTDTLIK